jgi:hypothetical protein
LQNFKYKRADQLAKERATPLISSLKNVPRPAAFTCASVEPPWLKKKTSFSKMYVRVYAKLLYSVTERLM